MAEKVGTYDPNSDERFPFHQDDLKYHHIKPKTKENSAAVIFFLMDVSGSMSLDRKFLARSFFFLFRHLTFFFLFFGFLIKFAPLLGHQFCGQLFIIFLIKIIISKLIINLVIFIIKKAINLKLLVIEE